MAQLEDQFEGDFKLSFHLAPPLLSRRGRDGHLKKREYGPWMMSVFRLLAKMKGLRGTALDPFGYGAERRMERALIVEYERLVDELCRGLTIDNHALAVEIASLPETIRGFGHVKDEAIKKANVRQADLLEAFRNPASQKTAAE